MKTSALSGGNWFSPWSRVRPYVNATDPMRTDTDLNVKDLEPGPKWTQAPGGYRGCDFRGPSYDKARAYRVRRTHSS